MSYTSYRIYWLLSGPHCAQAKPVKQVDGKTAYVCRHGVSNARIGIEGE